MIIQANGVNGETITKLKHKTTNAMRLLKRVTSRKSGMREASLTRLIHSFVMCHIAYVAAFHNWYKGEEAKINVLIRRVYKIASTRSTPVHQHSPLAPVRSSSGFTTR